MWKYSSDMASVNVDELSSSASSVAAPPEASRFNHTPYYCEENVYMLAKKLSADGVAKSDASDLFVVFISNDKKQIPMWNQKASHRADGVILWDYHVICIQKKKQSALPHLVWDLDSSLPLPSPLPVYVTESIRPSFQLFSEFERNFRVVHAPLFFQWFASDRRHMKDSAGNWVEPPPSHEVIVAQDGTVHNLNEYMETPSADAVKSIVPDVVDSIFTQKLGVVVGETQLEELFSQIS